MADTFIDNIIHRIGKIEHTLESLKKAVEASQKENEKDMTDSGTYHKIIQLVTTLSPKYVEKLTKFMCLLDIQSRV
jgi:hypothetical protein